MQRLALAIALISSATLLSGCIVLPGRHGGCHDGHRHFQGGAVYVQPGLR